VVLNTKSSSPYVSNRIRLHLENMENNHQCVPFGLFITNINLLLLLIFFSLAVLWFIWNKLPFKWYKKQHAVPSVDKLLLKQKKLHVLWDIQYGPLLFFSTVLYLILKTISLEGRATTRSHSSQWSKKKGCSWNYRGGIIVERINFYYTCVFSTI
jgi:hypothetical protein